MGNTPTHTLASVKNTVSHTASSTPRLHSREPERDDQELGERKRWFSGGDIYRSGFGARAVGHTEYYIHAEAPRMVLSIGHPLPAAFVRLFNP